MTKTKVCSRCGQDVPVEDFSVGRGLTRRNICNACQSEAVKNHRSRYGYMPWYEDDWTLKDK